MPSPVKKTIPMLILGFFLAWLGLKYLLPILFPFLLGILLALAAEPMVKRLSKKIPRPAAAVIGVAATLLLVVFALFFLMALLVREIGLLAKALPDLSEAAQGGLQELEGFLLRLTSRTPDGVRPLLSQAVSGLFSNGNAIIEQLLQRLPSIASSLLGWIPGSALALGTGILSGFMVSVRLPALRERLSRLRAADLIKQYLPVLRQIRTALGGWLKAQLKLILLCFLIVGAGLFLLRIPYAPVWGILIAFVDAVPILGTGTVLLPWSLISLLQGQSVKAVGLLGIYAVAVLARSILEPKLVGKHLGLDPLITLGALYAGFQLWGIPGMILSPMLCVVLLELVRSRA